MFSGLTLLEICIYLIFLCCKFSAVITINKYVEIADSQVLLKNVSEVWVILE